MWRKQDLVTAAESNLQAQKAENSSLKKQLKTVSGPGFMEEQARNELFMVKPGESGVILPSSVLTPKEDKKVIVLAPWQAWLRTFGFPY